MSKLDLQASFACSEGHPSRRDLTVLVAHNDDPTGKCTPHQWVATCGWEVDSTSVGSWDIESFREVYSTDQWGAGT